MKLLSWDVGIYNLSYCLLEKNDESDDLSVKYCAKKNNISERTVPNSKPINAYFI